MLRTLINGQEVFLCPGKKTRAVDEIWGEYFCSIWWPDGRVTRGSIEGDGVAFNFETLRNENGELI